MTDPMPAGRVSVALPERLPTLTGMRALAAGTVFLGHVLALYFFADPKAQDTASQALFLGKGFIGVSFFFILSGFVLTWVSRDTDTVRAFWRRRAVKIFPNHVLTFIAAVVLLAYLMGQSQGFFTAVANLFLLQSWFGLTTASSFNTVAWTLSCEALFYLLFPFILPVVRRIRDQLLWLCCGALVVVIWIIPSLATLIDPGPTSTPTLPPDNQYWFISILPAARLPEFIVGMLLARIVASGRRIPVGVGGGIALTLMAGLAADLLPLGYGLVAVWVIPLALTVAAGAVADVEGQRTFLSGRAMVWLGDISFAFYLWHLLVLATDRVYWTPPQGYATPVAIVVILALLAVTILISWATFALYERPLMRRYARARRRLTPLAPVSPADSVSRSADSL